MTPDTSNKKVSVIIPTYNRAKFLSSAVESIISQNYQNLEIIVVDDGSSDNTEDVIKSLQSRYPCVIYCKNKRGKGPSGARNTGILMADGEYLCFLDSDDIWLQDHLKKGLYLLERYGNVGVYFSNFKVVDYNTGELLYNFFDKKKVLHNLKSKSLTSDICLVEENIFISLVREGFFHLGGAIVRRSLTKGILFDESINFTEDRDFAIRLYMEAKAGFAFCKSPSFVLYTHDSNLHNNANADRWMKTVETHLYLFEKYFNTYKLPSAENKELSRIIFQLYLNLAYLFLKKKNVKGFLLKVLGSVRFSTSLVSGPAGKK